MEMEFCELGKLDEDNLSFSVISTVYQGKWLYVRNMTRGTCEIPGGRKEAGERIDNTARRELLKKPVQASTISNRFCIKKRRTLNEIYPLRRAAPLERKEYSLETTFARLYPERNESEYFFSPRQVKLLDTPFFILYSIRSSQ